MTETCEGGGVAEEHISREEYEVKGEDLVAKVKELVHQGNIRRVIIKNEDGRTLVEVPLLLGVGMVILLPAWAAIGAIAAVVANCTLVVERVNEGRVADEPAASNSEEEDEGGTKEA
jgi:hypothetical protein